MHMYPAPPTKVSKLLHPYWLYGWRDIFVQYLLYLAIRYLDIYLGKYLK